MSSPFHYFINVWICLNISIMKSFEKLRCLPRPGHGGPPPLLSSPGYSPPLWAPALGSHVLPHSPRTSVSHASSTGPQVPSPVKPDSQQKPCPDSARIYGTWLQPGTSRHWSVTPEGLVLLKRPCHQVWECITHTQRSLSRVKWA